MSLACPFVAPTAENEVLLWIGQSGRQYRLLPESFTDFQLRNGVVHVLISKRAVLWTGSAEDVVGDPQSRSFFRSAMAKKITVYRLEPTPEAEARVLVCWDILHGHSAEPLKLVEAH